MKAIIGLLVGALALTATAEEKRGDRPHRRGPNAEMLAKFDKNKDGKLDAKEREAVKLVVLKKFDKNKDGKLDEQERKAMFAERAKHAKGKGPKSGPKSGPKGQKGSKGEGKKK